MSIAIDKKEIIKHIEAAERFAYKSLMNCQAARQKLLGVSEPSAAPVKGAMLAKLPTLEEMKANRKKALAK